jgi:hypothetical protein
MWEGGLAEAANSDDEAANSVALWEGGFAEQLTQAFAGANTSEQLSYLAEHAPADPRSASPHLGRSASPLSVPAGWKYGPVRRGTFEARRHAAEAAHKAAAKAMADVIERKKKGKDEDKDASTDKEKDASKGHHDEREAAGVRVPYGLHPPVIAAAPVPPVFVCGACGGRCTTPCSSEGCTWGHCAKHGGTIAVNPKARPPVRLVCAHCARDAGA